jgi:uncharacterized protein YecE (DUF72 family)
MLAFAVAMTTLAGPKRRQCRTRILAYSGLSDVFFYFDNDQAGYAVRNALQLKAILADGAPGSECLR